MKTFPGTAVSPGLAVGNVERIDHGSSGLHRIVCDPFRERALYDVAVVLAKDELHRLCQRSKGDAADILLFQIALLEDESFTNEIGDYIAAGAGGAAAVERAEQIFTKRLNNVDNDYIRERSVDVRDVCRRVVDILDGRPRRRPHLQQPTILVAEQFFPSDLFTLDHTKILGLAADRDSGTSHAAIMARGMGIPMLVQLGDGVSAMAAGQRAILDADNGCLVVQPATIQLNAAAKRLTAGAAQTMRDPVLAQPSATRDGTTFRLFAASNLITLENITKAIEDGVEAIGLLRTESTLESAQGEEAQLACYEQSLARAEGRYLMVRTCDPGLAGDEDWAAEQCRTRMAGGRFYMPQLRALLRTTGPGELGLLLPMIHSVEDWQDANRLLDDCRREMQRQGVPLRPKLHVGCIIDNPSTAIMAGELLDQGAYVLAVDLGVLARLTCGMPRCGDEAPPVDSPAVKRLVAGIVQQGAQRGAIVYLYGINSDTVKSMPAYLELGVRNFCVERAVLPRLKTLLRDQDLSQPKL